MIPNRFHTRLPWYQCSNFISQYQLQKLKFEAKDFSLTDLHATPNPKNWYPEFVMSRKFSTATLATLVIWNVGTNASAVTLPITTLLLYPFWFHEYQAQVGDEQRIVVMFSGMYVASSLPCGVYQYRMTDSNGSMYYSEYFEVHNINWMISFHQKFTKTIYNATCTYAGIKYNGLPNLWHHLWLQSEGMLPESTLQEDSVVNLNGETQSTSNILNKKMLCAIPHASVPQIDAINTLPMYCHGENLNCKVFSRTPLQPRIDVIDVEVEKPEYDKNEIAATIKLKIQIDPTLADSGCCDGSEITCYDEAAVPAPTLVVRTGTSIGVSIGNSPLPVAEALAANLLPVACIVRIWYRVTGSPTWLQFGTTYTTGQLAGGVTITGLVAATTYEVALTIDVYGTSGCQSVISEFATLALP